MNTLRLSRALLAGLALTLPVAWVDGSMAQGRPATQRKAPKGPKLDVPALEAQLKSRNAGEMRAALAIARPAGPAAAPLAPTLERILRDGLPSDLSIEAMQTLAAIGSETSSGALSTLTHHRDPKLRREAARALIKTRGPEAVKALRRCMSDGDGAVREVAASGLGQLGAKEMVPDLFVALDHKVAEAAGAIGQLCDAAQCEQLLGKLTRISFDILSPGFDQILFRPTSEVSDDLKIKVVGRVREMGTVESNRLLKDVQGRWPAKGSKKVKQAIDQAVIATEGGAGAKPEGGAQ
ncbi:MAG: HEAT repeat domain-containing protein [Deltaproteobacteria bacterium]|nr:HEAT repeat domain-containing protein [Deltaproteobacteria bacterium]